MFTLVTINTIQQGKVAKWATAGYKPAMFLCPVSTTGSVVILGLGNIYLHACKGCHKVFRPTSVVTSIRMVQSEGLNDFHSGTIFTHKSVKTSQDLNFVLKLCGRGVAVCGCCFLFIQSTALSSHISLSNYAI